MDFGRSPESYRCEQSRLQAAPVPHSLRRPGSLRAGPNRTVARQAETAAESGFWRQQLFPARLHRKPRRPHVSNDNPFSESQFKTLKYCPEFPRRFASYDQAIEFCSTFFHRHNFEHHHGGLALLRPATVHHGQTDAVLAARQAGLNAAYAAHPERFVRKPPRPLSPPSEVWINPPADGSEPRTLELPRYTNSDEELSQTG